MPVPPDALSLDLYSMQLSACVAEFNFERSVCLATVA